MTNEEFVTLIQAGERDRLPELWGQGERFWSVQARRLLVAIGDRAAAHGLEYSDLYNSGYIALVDAADSYDPKASAPFITWFSLRLKTAFAEAGGWRTRRQKRDPLNSSTSMNKPIGEDSDNSTAGDFIPDPAAAQAFQDVKDQLYQEQLHATLERALGTLKDDEKAVIRGRYYQGCTLKEMGPKARTLESRAFAKLRRSQARKELEQFVEPLHPILCRTNFLQV